MQLGTPIPILRIFDEAKAKEFYLDFLGFRLDWEHRFEAHLPLYMQIVHGATPMQSGFMMLPMVGGMMTASIMTGQVISRTGIIRPFPVVGSVLIVVAMLSLSTIDADTALWFVMVMMFVLGIGLGCNMQPLILIVQNAVSPREIGVATSSATFFRQIGGTLGVAVFLSLLFYSVGDKIKTSLISAAKTAE